LVQSKLIKPKLAGGDASAACDARQVRETYGLLGLFKAEPQKFIAAYEAKNADAQSAIPKEVTELVSARAEAKKNKDWARADELRAQITALGYAVKDTKDGAIIQKL